VLITAIIGVLMQPWVLFFNALSYAITWLSGYGGFLGAIGGIMIADYWLLRNRQLKLDDLYRSEGIYSYGGSGVNRWAIVALLIGIVPPAIGWLHQIQVYQLPNYPGSVLDWLQIGSWFWSFFAALVAYYVLMSTAGARQLQQQLERTAETARLERVTA
jgi:NCS1 family nucleobase:cation symporter-1